MKIKTLRIKVIGFFLLSAANLFFLVSPASAALLTAVLPYKIISSAPGRYSYIAKGIPLIISSKLTSADIPSVESSAVSSYIEKNGLNLSASSLSAIAKNFKAGAVVYGRIIEIGGTFIIQTNLFDASSGMVIYRGKDQVFGTKPIIGSINKESLIVGDKIKSIQKLVPAAPLPATSQATNSAHNGIFIKRFSGNASGLSRTGYKGYLIKAFCSGRLLSHGIQTAVATPHRVILYGMSVSGNLVRLAQYKLPSRSNVIYLGIYGQARNRTSKNSGAIIVTQSRLGTISSFLLFYKNKSLFKSGKNYNMFSRVMDIPGYGTVIAGQNPVSVIPSDRYFNDYVIGQNSYPIGQFGGNTSVYRFGSISGDLSKTAALPFYRGMTLYGTAYGNFLDNSKNYLVALTNSGKLMVVNNKGKAVYTGSKTFGGSTLQVRVPSFGGVQSSSYTGGGMVYDVPPQLEGSAVAGSGLDIVVIKNYPQAAFLKNLKYYSKGAIFDLRWNKVGFFPVWEIKPVTGYIAGFSIFEKNGYSYLADGVVENPGSPLTEPKSYIAVYKLGKTNKP